MKKKLIASILVFTMCMGVLTSCNKAADTTKETTSSEEELTITSREEIPTTEETTTEILDQSDEVVGNYEWNPYVWCPMLTDAYVPTAEQTTYNCINALLNGEDTFEYGSEMDVYSLSMISYIVCPYLFEIVDFNIYVDDNLAYMTYNCSPEEAQDIINTFAHEVELIMSESVAEGDSDTVKAMMIHYNYSKTLTYDYVAADLDIDEIESDDGSSHEVTPYRAMVDREGICQSFSMAEAHLMLQAGLDVNLVGGESPICAHMWVLLNLNDELIFLDPTWEDTHDGTGLSFFGINTSVYNANNYEVDNLAMYDMPSYDGNLTAITFEVLWEMQEIISISKEDGTLEIEFIDCNGENQVFTV